MTLTATMSPTSRPVTWSPMAVTRPTISWPGTIGNSWPQGPTEWRSVWQMPQKRTSKATSSGRGSRCSKSKGVIGASRSSAA